jgi:CheY-like chemotaxis protein
MTQTDKKKVLIVDPQADVRQTLALRLEVLGLEVLEAGTSSALTTLLSNQNPELVITEWSLPGLEGERLIEKLLPRQRPIIVFTELKTEDIASQAEKAGARTVLNKKKRSLLLDQMKAFALDPSSIPPAPGHAQRHILLIEDSPTVRNFVRKSLSPFLPDCVIREAADGRAALSEMSQKKVDLIVTDLDMPGMDGRTFLRMMRSNPLLKKKPVLVLSGSITSDLLGEFKDDPNLCFLRKPSTAEDILGAAKGLLK